MRHRVILVPFPFDDLTGSKVRPAVCLTDAIGAHRHVVLAFITSVVPPTMEPTDLLLDPANADFAHNRVEGSIRVAPAPHGDSIGHDYPAAVGSADGQPPSSSSAAPAHTFRDMKSFHPSRQTGRTSRMQ